MADPTNPAALLERAAEVIERNGWAPAAYYETPIGDDGQIIAHDPKACRVCPRGAIAIAAGQHPMFAVHYDPVETHPPYSDEQQAAYTEIRAAEALLVDHLIEGGFGAAWEKGEPSVIEVWADEKDRTLPQILGAMRAAAERGRTDG